MLVQSAAGLASSDLHLTGVECPRAVGLEALVLFFLRLPIDFCFDLLRRVQLVGTAPSVVLRMLVELPGAVRCILIAFLAGLILRLGLLFVGVSGAAALESSIAFAVDGGRGVRALVPFGLKRHGGLVLKVVIEFRALLLSPVMFIVISEGGLFIVVTARRNNVTSGLLVVAGGRNGAKFLFPINRRLRTEFGMEANCSFFGSVVLLFLRCLGLLIVRAVPLLGD